MRAMRGLFAGVCGAVAAVIGGGCESGPTAPAGPGYMELYLSGRYVEAYSTASTQAKESPAGAERERASLVAGQSAHALDRDLEAEPWLKPLLLSEDPVIAGKAGATLGLIAQETGRHSEAITLLQPSVERLSGDDAARAAVYTGDSYRALGQESQARSYYERAQRQASSDVSLRSMVADRLRPKAATAAKQGGFSVQLGAYSSQQRAQAVADRARLRAQGLSLGAPRVVETKRGSQTLYVVQVGRFSTRPAAEGAQKRLATAGSKVMPADD